MKRLWLIVGLSFCMLTSACDSDPTKLGDRDRSQIFLLLKSGIEHQSDPYVRAETLRIIELLRDPEFNSFAESRLDDPSAMVRIAAFRVLLVNHHPDSKDLALKLFGSSNPTEQMVVLKATLDFAPEPLQRELIGRALRSKDPEIRRVAFRQGYIDRIDQAIADGNTKYLEQTLYPELARFMSLDDPTLAAQALAKFLEVGQTDRAESFIRTFSRGDVELAERLKAARVLVGAGADSARPHFESVLERQREILADNRLGVPIQPIPPELLRAATLGLTAIGEESTIATAQSYLTGANRDQTIEVLEALARNPSAETEVSVRIAMQDSREEVRNRAIDLYAARADASPEALARAMTGVPFATQRRIARILHERFKDEWVAHLKSHLQRMSETDLTLNLLRDVMVTQDEVNDILRPLQEPLTKLSTDNNADRAALAAYLLALTSDPLDDQSIADLDRRLDDHTRYAFIEFQVRENHMAYQRLFRVYFHADLYAIRLISAAGMWRANQQNAETQPDTT